jgi:cbb3-type cytochrome oxidase subunit 3
MNGVEVAAQGQWLPGVLTLIFFVFFCAVFIGLFTRHARTVSEAAAMMPFDDHEPGIES